MALGGKTIIVSDGGAAVHLNSDAQLQKAVASGLLSPESHVRVLGANGEEARGLAGALAALAPYFAPESGPPATNDPVDAITASESPPAPKAAADGAASAEPAPPLCAPPGRPMIESPDQWFSVTGDEYAIVIQQARNAGAYEARIGTFTPTLVVMLVVVAFIPPLFVVWSLGLILLVLLTKGDALLIGDTEIIHAVKRGSTYRLRRVRHDSLKDVQARSRLAWDSFLDRVFGYGCIVAYREGQVIGALSVENVKNPGQVVAEWRRRAGR